MKKTSIIALLLAALSFGLVAAPAVQASDAGVRKTVKRYQARTAPLAERFAKADAAVKSSADIPAAATAAGKFRTGLRKYKKALSGAKAESTQIKRGKAQLLDAIRKFDLALVEYQGLVQMTQTGATEQQVQESLQTIQRRIRDAAKSERAALKKLGFRVIG